MATLFERAGAVLADLTLAASTESNPEGTAELHEQLEKVERWSRDLSPEQIEVLRCICGARMSLDETVAAVGRPRATVHDQLKAATEKLRERERESERAAAKRVGRHKK